MKSLIILVAALVWGATATARADVSCEAARCAVQTAINQNCVCTTATNHGRYVSCVAHQVKALVATGAVPKNCKGKVTRCASKSTCGKASFVTCNVTLFGTCDVATGACTTGTLAVGLTTCAANTDCPVGTKCKIKRDAEHCTATGGTVGTSPTCCADCTPVP